MKVSVMCFGAFKDYLPSDATGNRCEVELDDGAPVRAAIEALGAPVALAFGVLVDGVQAPVDRPLSEGAEVTLMPPYSGGSGPSERTVTLGSDPPTTLRGL